MFTSNVKDFSDATTDSIKPIALIVCKLYICPVKYSISKKIKIGINQIKVFLEIIILCFDEKIATLKIKITSNNNTITATIDI